MSQLFATANESSWTDLGKGVSRLIMAHNDELMLVKVRFAKGSVGEMHNHPHVQTSYVSRGKFKYVIENEERVLHVGDSCVIPSMLMHGCECLEEGELIDAFTPVRSDFL